MQMGWTKMAISDKYLASSRAVNAATARCYQHGAAGPWQVVTLTTAEFVDGGRRRRNIYDEKSQLYAKDNRTAFNCTQ